MKKIIMFFVYAVSLFAAMQVYAGGTMERIEEAIETERLNITLDDSLNGYVMGAICDDCKNLRVMISPDTKATRNGVYVPLLSAKKQEGKRATVVFDPKTLKVNRISWTD